MGEIREFSRAKLIIGVLMSGGDKRASIKQALQADFGPIDHESSLIPFTWSHYYDREMGLPIQRWFVSFAGLFAPDGISAVKLRSNAMEDLFRVEGRRMVNLDPGLLFLSRLCLVTTKDNAHRLPLRDGIYGELTLLYRNGDFEALPWTYPDYASRESRDILLEIRSIHTEELKRGGASARL
jgi:hypothetical protein